MEERERERERERADQMRRNEMKVKKYAWKICCVVNGRRKPLWEGIRETIERERERE